MEFRPAETQGKWTVVAAAGRVDAQSAPELDGVCRQRIAEGARWLAVDLGDVPYLSSAGLRVILATLSALRKKSGGFALIAPQDNVREVLELTGFSGILTVVPDRASLPAP